MDRTNFTIRRKEDGISKKQVLKVVVIILALGALSYACFYFGAKFGAKKAVAMMRAQVQTPYVLTGHPSVKSVAQNTRFIALVKPINAVDVKTQVAGAIEEVLFTDGQYVHAGDVLFKIEQDRYKANVDAARATLSKAEADLKQLNSEYGRQKQLHKDKVVSTADLERAESKLAQAKAAVEQAKASLDLAEIDLKHTSIESPIDGRIGQVLITKGNYVGLSSAPLARIVQTTPVKISFSLTDKEHLQARRMLKDNGEQYDLPDLQIELADKSLLPLPAKHIFLDNEMDKDTATMGLYAEYDNSDELLIPNNHVTVLWKASQEAPALLVPQKAVYNDNNGAYVMLVKSDNTVVQQYIKQGGLVDDNVIVEDGLQVSDLIVTSGGQKLKNGQGIHIINSEENK